MSRFLVPARACADSKCSLVEFHRGGVLNEGRKVDRVDLVHHGLGQVARLVVYEHKPVGVRVRGPDLGGKLLIPVQQLDAGLERGLGTQRVHVLLVQKVPLVCRPVKLDVLVARIVVEDRAGPVQVLEVDAWLDDLHNMNWDLSGRGTMQGAWDLPGSAPYVGHDDPAKPTILAEFVGGVKIWRIENDVYRIKFYGPRSRLPFAGEPSLFAVYAEVLVANATKWDSETWTVKGPKLHHYAFMSLLKKGFPRIMSVLMLMPDQIAAQTAEDERVRAWWAKQPTYPVTVYQQ